MANSTQKYARNVHGTDPQNLVELITRKKVYRSRYYKEHCFALDASRLAEKAIDTLKYVASSYGGLRKPSPFICLILTMLQIQPKPEIVEYLIQQPTHKYLSVLAAFYLRLVGTAEQIYRNLSPLLADRRKIRVRKSDGTFELTFVDCLIDEFLREDRVFEITLPRLINRRQLLEKDVVVMSVTEEGKTDSLRDEPFIRKSDLFTKQKDIKPGMIRRFVYKKVMDKHKPSSKDDASGGMQFR